MEKLMDGLIIPGTLTLSGLITAMVSSLKMTKKNSPILPELKPTGKGMRTGLTEDGLLYIVVDTNIPIGKSKQGNPLFALSNGVCGTPHGKGIFLSLLVGKVADAPK
jgi:hypothetical protein